MPDGRVRFGPFEADTATGELWRGGQAVRIQELPFRLLAALIERQGELVTRAELADRLWGAGVHVDAEAGLNTAVAKLREALGDTASTPSYVETVPRRGYRFRALVTPASDGAPSTAPAEVPMTEAGDRSPRAGAWRRRLGIAAALLLIVVTLTAIAASHRTTDAPVRVAVALFDNETDDAALDRLAQLLTDATVTRLTGNERLAVIGNAAVLRTSRPFRDLELIQETLGAELIVIGQVQQVDDSLRVLTHLIRSSDQAHVWVQPTPLAGAEAAFIDAVSEAVAAAVEQERSTPAAARAPR